MILIKGLLPSTPLGSVVSIRSENDPKVIKEFSPSQRAMRVAWRNKIAKEKEADGANLDSQFDSLEIMLKNAFG